MNNIKRIVCAALALCMLLGVAAVAEGVTFTPGTYTSIVDGRNGPIVMQMDATETAITDVRVITHNETYLTGNVIEGLYACGECADEGTMGDAPLTVNVVFGTLAAKSAAEDLK